MMESSEELSSLAPALDSTTAEGLLSREARPRCLQLEDNVQLTLRGVNLNEDSDAEDMVGIRLWIEKNYLVTTRFRRLKTVLDIRQRLLHDNGPKTIGEIVSHIDKKKSAKSVTKKTITI